jgi:anti-sigma regulatory factor (Ser/Thr protein kinase)
MLDGDQRCDAVALATSELVTNVLLHADGAQAIDVQLSRRDDVVRVRVANAGVGFDVSPISHGEGPGGWGLEIVAAVSRTWGVEERAGETVVSFEI